MKLILMLILALNSIAFASADCDSIPSLEKEVGIRTSNADSAKQYSQNLTEIAKDAKNINKKSAALGISSGLLLIGTGASIAFLGEGVLYEAGIVGHTYFALKIFPGFAGGLVGAALVESIGLSGTAANLLLSLVMSTAANIESVIYIGNGVYQIAKGKDVVKIDLKEISQSELKIIDYLSQLRQEISNQIASPPSEFWNAFSMGGRNANHYASISEKSEVYARLHYDLLSISKAKLAIAKKACAQ